jgi:hypothetical protein
MTFILFLDFGRNMKLRPSSYDEVLQGRIQNMVSWGADIWVEDFDKNYTSGENCACLNIWTVSCSCNP